MKKPNLNELTLKEKIGQMMLIGQTLTLNDTSEGYYRRRGFNEIDKIIEEYQPGGFWAQGNVDMAEINLAEISHDTMPTSKGYKNMLDRILSKARIPVLVATDCENGTGGLFVDGTKSGTGFTIGAANDKELTYDLSAAIARELKTAGIHWRWSPVVDLSCRLCGGGIGRGFAEDTDRISCLSTAAIQGTQSEGVAATAKHFPGHDPYEFRDAHIVPTSVDISLEEWEQTQGKTFRSAIDAGVMTIMVGHGSFPAVDDEKINGRYVPATASSKIIQGLLREKLGFKGVVITDGLSMSGLSTIFSYEEKLIRCVNAGNDVLLCVAPSDVEIIYKAVCDGRIPVERIDESCRRILDLKDKLGLFNDNRTVPDMAEEKKKTSELNKRLCEKSITLLYDRNEMLPLSKDKIKKAAIVLSAHAPKEAADISVIVSQLEKRGAQVEVFEGYVARETLSRLAEEKDIILYVGYLAPHLPVGMPSFYGDTAKTYFAAFSKGIEKSVGISLGYPYIHYDMMAGAQTFVNAYSNAPDVQEALVKALYGEIAFMGDSPVDIEPKLRYVRC